MQLEITTDNETRLPETVALVQRLNKALTEDDNFKTRMTEINSRHEGVMLHWSINNRGWNDSHRLAGVHSVTVHLCGVMKCLVPLSFDHGHIHRAHKDARLIPIVECEVRVTAREKGLELSSNMSRGALQSEAEMTADLLSWMTWDHAKNWLKHHPRGTFVHGDVD